MCMINVKGQKAVRLIRRLIENTFAIEKKGSLFLVGGLEHVFDILGIVIPTDIFREVETTNQ